jgi:hypothetical protein
LRGFRIGDVTQKVADWKANYSRGISQNIVEEMAGNEKISGESYGWIAPEKVESRIVWCNPSAPFS